MEELYARLRAMQKKARFGVISCLVLFVGMFVSFLAGMWYVGLGLALVLAVTLFFTYRSNKTYSRTFKKEIVHSMLGEVFTDLEFDPERGIDSDVVYGTGMIRSGNRYSANDLITGKYNGVEFCQSDVHIEEETHDSDGGSNTSTIFRGRWMIFEFNKEFRCDLQVISKGFYAYHRKGGLFAKEEDKLRKVEFENEEFNKRFRVYAQDEHEAFYILTPHMIESLMRLQELSDGAIMLAFVGGTLHIALHNNKDAFEPKLFGEINPEEDKNRVLGEIRVITNFVDEMSLDRDIYKY